MTVTPWWQYKPGGVCHVAEQGLLILNTVDAYDNIICHCLESLHDEGHMDEGSHFSGIVEVWLTKYYI